MRVLPDAERVTITNFSDPLTDISIGGMTRANGSDPPGYSAFDFDTAATFGDPDSGEYHG
jgi:hypothetical protein